MECDKCEADIEIGIQDAFFIETPHVLGRDDFTAEAQCPECGESLTITYFASWAETEAV